MARGATSLHKEAGTGALQETNTLPDCFRCGERVCVEGNVDGKGGDVQGFQNFGVVEFPGPVDGGFASLRFDGWISPFFQEEAYSTDVRVICADGEHEW